MTFKPDGYNSILEEKRHLRCKVPQKMKNLTHQNSFGMFCVVVGRYLSMYNIVCVCYSMQHAVLLVWRALQECYSTCIEAITFIVMPFI